MRLALALAASLALTACPPELGQACRQHSDCKAKGSWCARAELCTSGCDGGGPCAAGTACVVAGPREVCLPSCTADADCLKGFACRELPGGQVCVLADPLAKPPP